MSKSGTDPHGAHGAAPSGQSRALPWATAALLAVTLVATLLGTSPSELESPGLALRAAAALWSRSAYLDAQPEILIEVGRGLAPAARRSRLDLLREAAEADPPDAAERAAQQEQLDRLTERALVGARRRAWTAWVPAHPSVSGLLAHAWIQRDLLGWLTAAPVLALLAAALEVALGYRILLAALALGCFGPPLFLSLMLPGSELALRGSSALSATLLGVAALRFAKSGAAFPVPVWADGRVELRTLVLPLRGLVFLCVLEELLAVARAGLGEHPYQASLGGLALGAGAALLAQRKLALPPPRSEASPEVAQPQEGVTLLEQARKARARGENGVALVLLRQAVRDQPEDADVVVELWEVSRACGRPDVGMPRMLALVQRCVARGELSPGARHWLRIREVDPHVQLAPESAIPLASALARLRERGPALATLRGAFEDSAARVSGALALQAVELARALEDEALAQQAAKVGLALPYLSPEIRARLQSSIGSADAPAPASAPPSEPLPTRAPDPGPVPLAALAPVAPVQVDPAPAEIEPVVAAPAVRLRRIAVLEGIPDRLGERALSLRLSDRTLELGYERIQAIAVAGLPGEVASEPLMVVDLVLNWNAAPQEPLHVIRVRGDLFDPRLLVGDALGLLEAGRIFLHELRTHTRAVALPDEAAAEGRPLRLYASLADYEREVLGVSR